MAEQTQTTTGGSTPDYSLDSGVLQAYKEAGGAAGGSDVAQRVGRMQGDTAVAQAALGAAQEVGEAIGDRRKKKHEFKVKQEEDWNKAFDEMDSRMGWASPAMYEKFVEVEEAEKEKYITALNEKPPNKALIGKLLTAQATRGKQLQAYKSTMATADATHKGVGWSTVMKNDPVAASVLTQMAKMEDDLANNMVFGKVDSEGNFTAQEEGAFDGEMCFKVNVPVIGKDGQPTGETEEKYYTNSMLNKMIETGTRRHDLEGAYLTEMVSYQQLGASGNPWPGDDMVRRQMEGSINKADIPHLIAEDLGSSGSFGEHIKSHPDWALTFADGNFTYTTTVKSKDGTKDVSPTSPDSPGGATITAAELAAFNEDDMEMIIGEMAKEKNHDVMKGYYSEYKMEQARSNFEQGGGNLEPVNQETTEFRRFWYGLNPNAREKYLEEHDWDEIEEKLFPKK